MAKKNFKIWQIRVLCHKKNNCMCQNHIFLFIFDLCSLHWITWPLKSQPLFTHSFTVSRALALGPIHWPKNEITKLLMDSRFTHLEILGKKFQPKSHKVMIWWQSYIENPNTMKINKATTHQNMLIKNTQRNSKLSVKSSIVAIVLFWT